uniref:Uncharacterized protein n=1 Tax=Tanacetum cinerariifolium TaxID=118510 RepID=A0A699GKE6_TANCI|nr:hypothetical protein [Tanacetum cinerariifolium]
MKLPRLIHSCWKNSMVPPPFGAERGRTADDAVDVDVGEDGELAVARIEAAHVGRVRAHQAARVFREIEVVVARRVGAQRGIVVFRRQRQRRAAAPAAHHFRSQQVLRGFIAGLAADEVVERTHPAGVFAQHHERAVAAQLHRLGHGDRLARFTVFAEDEFAGGDGAFLAGQGRNAAAGHERLRNRVAEAERILGVGVGAEAVLADQGDAVRAFELVHRLGDGHVQCGRVAGIDGQRHVAGAGLECGVPVRGRIVVHVAQLLGAPGHALLERQREAGQRRLGHAQRLESLEAQGHAHPGVAVVGPAVGRRDVVGHALQQCAPAGGVVDVQHRVQAHRHAERVERLARGGVLGWIGGHLVEECRERPVHALEAARIDHRHLRVGHEPAGRVDLVAGNKVLDGRAVDAGPAFDIGKQQVHQFRNLGGKVVDVAVPVAVVGGGKQDAGVVVEEHEAHIVQGGHALGAVHIAVGQIENAAQALGAARFQRRDRRQLRHIAGLLAHAAGGIGRALEVGIMLAHHRFQRDPGQVRGVVRHRVDAAADGVQRGFVRQARVLMVLVVRLGGGHGDVLSVGDVGSLARFDARAGVHRVAEGGGPFVRGAADAHDAAQRLVRDHAVPGIKRQHVVAVNLPGGMGGRLRPEPQRGNRPVRRQWRRPGDGRVFHGHCVEVGAQLRAQGAFGAVPGEVGADGVAQAGVLDVLERQSGQAAHAVGRRVQRQLGDVVAVTDGRLRMVRLAQRVMVVARQAVQRGAGRAAQRFHELLGAVRGAGHQALERVGRVCVRLQQGQHALVLGNGAEGQRREIHHQEILVVAFDGGRQPLAIDADDFQCKPARGGNGVGMDVAGRRRQPRHHRVRARLREHALTQFGGQVGMDGQFARDQAVGFGVGVADRMAVALERAARRRGHGLDDLAGQRGFVVGHHFDVGGVGQGGSSCRDNQAQRRSLRRARPGALLPWCHGGLNLVRQIRLDEVLACIVQQLDVGRMVDGFDTDDLVGDIGMALGQVAHERQLFHAGADHQNLLGVAQHGNHVVHIAVIRFGAVVAGYAAFLVLRAGLDDIGLGVVTGEMDDMGFGLVQPDNCVLERHGDFP